MKTKHVKISLDLPIQDKRKLVKIAREEARASHTKPNVGAIVRKAIAQYIELGANAELKGDSPLK